MLLFSKGFAKPLASARLFFLAIVFSFAAHCNATNPASVDYLRCEYHANPLGIEVLVPRLSWEMHDTRRGAGQAAYQILVASSPEKLASDQGDLWDSGKVAGDQSAQIEYHGKALTSRAQCHWKVRIWDRAGQPTAWSAPAMWTMGLLDPKDFTAKWIGYEPAGPTTQPSDAPMPCPLLRKEFSIDQPIRRATLYASALGNFQMHLNGKQVGDDYFTSDWTDYRKRVYYYTYDVTDLVKQGPNALAGMLGAGWYCGAICLRHEGKFYGQYPRLAAQLELELTDGTRKTIVSDESWKTAAGPILEGEFQAGETYDATKEIAGWDEPGLDDSKWNPVRVTDQIAAKLQAFPGDTVQQTGQLTPAKITQPKPGVFVFDLGQNHSGVARLKVRGPRGTRVVLRFAEWLNPDGTLNTTTLQNARCIDTYVLKGDGEEIYQPRFTYRGHQYVEVTGFPGTPDKSAITGIVLGSNTPMTSEFECSNPMVNKLFSNIVWGQRSNFISVPTDCPQRDERMGWTGDAQIFVRAATYNADIAAFYTKWLIDLDDTQSTQGQFADIAPEVSKEGVFNLTHGQPGWGDAGTICPWTIYWVYGDRRLLEKNYPAMVGWVEFCRSRSRRFLMPDKGRSDWLPVGEKTPRDLFATAHFAQSTKLTALAAKALGKDDDAKNYSELFDQIKAAFNKAYVGPDGRLKGNTETDYALAIAWDLLTPENREHAAKYLPEDIQNHDNRMTTGFAGTGLLLPALSAVGQTDLAYQLLQSDKYPSWGFMIKQGATTLFESWDGVTPDKGVAKPEPNSLNHYAFGTVGQWMFQNMAGIDTAEPGFKKLYIHPEPGERIDWCKASYHSIQGKITTSWKKQSGKLLLDIIIPPNTSAIVALPCASDTNVLESGVAIREAKNITVIGVENSSLKINVDAGECHFEIPWK